MNEFPSDLPPNRMRPSLSSVPSLPQYGRSSQPSDSRAKGATATACPRHDMIISQKTRIYDDIYFAAGFRISIYRVKSTVGRDSGKDLVYWLFQQYAMINIFPHDSESLILIPGIYATFSLPAQVTPSFPLYSRISSNARHKAAHGVVPHAGSRRVVHDSQFHPHHPLFRWSPGILLAQGLG